MLFKTMLGSGKYQWIIEKNVSLQDSNTYPDHVSVWNFPCRKKRVNTTDLK